MMLKFSPDEAKRKIEHILENGSIRYTHHCKEKMSDRSVTSQDIQCVLKNGKIFSEAVWDEDHEHWKYKVEGVDLDDDELTVITIIFDSEMQLKIVTVF